MQGNANVNSVELPVAPRKQRIMTTSQMQLMVTTKRQFFMKVKRSQVSLILPKTNFWKVLKKMRMKKYV
jgi:hypothetical protein